MVFRRAMTYPIEGFLYLISSPSLWGSVCCTIIFGLIIAITSTLLLFIFTLKQHAEWFGGFKWWSWVLAVLAVLFESLIVTFVALKVSHAKTQQKIFIRTMQQKGRWDSSRMVAPSIVPGICQLRFFIRIATMPLNLVPGFGNILFAYINAPFEAKETMGLYFDSLQLDDKQRWIEVYGSPRQSCVEMYACSTYLRFGFMATLLESIPIAGPTIFNLSNACGAALWAAQMEAETGGPPSLLDTNGPGVALDEK